MKKLLLFGIIVSMSIGVFGVQAAAQSKALQKAMKKEYKLKMKEYEKGGWKIFGTSHTLDVALLTHYDNLTKDGVTEVMGTAVSSNKNIGKDKVLMSACVTYAQKIGSNIKGRIVEDMGSVVSTEELAEFEHFYEAYENSVQAEIKGELRNSYSIYRPVEIQGKEAYEFQTYYIVDENEASRARIRAFQNAAKESAVAQKYAEQVSEFINEAF
ncbi:MAG: hypothetical protein OSJ55_01035 [Bacteroidales bacterium]|nr:hypothetical protein [Bacteroidales bacterium]